MHRGRRLVSRWRAFVAQREELQHSEEDPQV